MLELSGKTVLTTRSREQAKELVTLLEKRGATVLSQPSIEILPPTDFADVDSAIRAIRSGKFDWILFSSANGVRRLWNRFDALLGEEPQDVFFSSQQERAFVATRRALAKSRDVAEWNAETFEEKIAAQTPFLTTREESAVGALRRAAFDETRRATQTRGAELGRVLSEVGAAVAVVGPGTADAAREIGVRVDLIPDEFNAEGLVEALEKANGNLVGQKILSVRANRGRDVLTQGLRKLGADVREVVAYRSVDVETPNPEIVEALKSGRIDRGIVASSATAKAVAKMFDVAALAKTSWIALSAAIAQTLQELGAPVVGVAENATMESLVDAVVASEGRDPFERVRATSSERRAECSSSFTPSLACDLRSRPN